MNIRSFLRTDYFLLALFIFGMGAPLLYADQIVRLGEMDLSTMTVGWGRPQANKSIESKPLTVNGRVFDYGVGSHASSRMYIELTEGTKRFEAWVGVDDEVGKNNGSVCFKIYSNNDLLFDSGLMKEGQAPKRVELDLSGKKRLTLIVNNGDDGSNFDHADWGEANFIVEDGGIKPKAIAAPFEEKIILTPKPGPAPRINGPSVYGVRPGRPFLYRIPATGKRPMRFGAAGLPEGLKLDRELGILSGVIAERTAKTWAVTLTAENSAGKAQRAFKIVVGDTIALTPPMGWNHWYIHYQRVTDKLMRQAADTMISSGMADCGYQYVNIDDCWMNAAGLGKYNPEADRVGPLRDKDGNIIPNRHFPDMPGLTDYIHSLGLKAGIYISPGPQTCCGFCGSWQHEKQDAEQFAQWGFDFLKYDWCSYGSVAGGKALADQKKPYVLMGQLLHDQPRDMIFNLCQYGMGNVWTWGREIGGHCWRTAGDLGFELSNYHDVALRNARLYPWAGPGAWNDPDYLLLGYIGNAKNMVEESKPCSLTASEQYSYMSLWCLMAAPLFFSGDMERLDDFTLNVLCNPEVIAIDQDALGKQGYPKVQNESYEIWIKPLEDGSLAVGLFNRGEMEQSITLQWSDIGIEGSQSLRDLWRQCDLGEKTGSFTAPVTRHGVMLLKLSPAKK